MLRNERVQAIARLLYRHNTQWDRFAKWKLDTKLAPMVKRIATPVQITVADADFTGPSIKKAQNWKYPGGVIARHHRGVFWSADGKVEYYDPKELSDPNDPKKGPKEARRRQESNFFITINTNRSPTAHPGEATAAYKAIEETLREMADEAVVCSMLRYGPKDFDTYGRDKYVDIIEDVDWKAGVETGEKYERLHAHIWLTIKHYSQIQVNTQVMGHVFKTTYNGKLAANSKMRVMKNPYVSVKLLPQTDFTTIMKQYMHKGMTPPGATLPTQDFPAA